MKKHCKYCSQTKDESEFGIIKKPNGKFYLRNKCRECTWGGSKYIKTFQRNGEILRKDFNWLF